MSRADVTHGQAMAALEAYASINQSLHHDTLTDEEKDNLRDARRLQRARVATYLGLPYRVES